MNRSIPEDRIKTIAVSTIMSEEALTDNTFVKITKDKMIEDTAKGIAEKLFEYDKVLIQERKLDKFTPPSTVLFILLDIIVPETMDRPKT